jgi:bifunctional glutamyl/prolyl-tRNA synthetase
VDEISNKIKEVGESVRNLKLQKAAKDEVDKAVKSLLELKAEYKKVSGQDWVAEGGAAPRSAAKPAAAATPKPAAAAAPKPAAVNVKSEEGLKKQTRLGLEAKKEENLPDWYSQVSKIIFSLAVLVANSGPKRFYLSWCVCFLENGEIFLLPLHN